MRPVLLLALLACHSAPETKGGADPADGGGGADGGGSGDADGGGEGTDTAPAGDDTAAACDPVIPPWPASDTGGADTGEPPLPEVDPTGLVGHWPLDGDWTDAVGDLDLVALRAGGFSASDVARDAPNSAYGPTGATADNGALSATAPALDLSAGLTMEGWYYKPDNNTKGILFGFGSTAWGAPKLLLQDAWGALVVSAGKTDGSVSFPRPTNGCWHHLALVLPPGFDSSGGLVSLYVDGVAQTPSSGDGTLPGGLDLFGGSFTLGTFSLPYGAAMRLDEVRLWTRSLSAEEVAIAALARGPGEACPSAREPWEPGPRCTFDEGDRPSAPVMQTELRVLDDRTVVVLADPMPWLYEQMDAHCGAYLQAMEENVSTLDEWWWHYQYHFALSEALTWAWPVLNEQWSDPAAWRVAGCAPGEEATIPAETIRWISPTREARIPRVAPGTGTVHGAHAERLLMGYLRLPFSMQEGATYAVQDRWGNRQSLTFSSADTISWAIKVNQVGGPADHPGRRAILGGWLGPAGALDLSRFAGVEFTVVDEATGAVALRGTVGDPRDSAETGEQLLDLDLSALSTPGQYHVVVPGLGRSWTFEVGPDAMGEAFYVHAQGLTLNRCAPISTDDSPWGRGDIHTVYEAAFPPDDDDYDDHSAAGWGILDSAGRYVSLGHFDVVAATATTTALPVHGGWHDAGDYDRRPYHFGVVEDLLMAYALAPENFSDGQLGLPEAGNGRPDIVDEALFGMEMWRSAQQADGGVGTWVEATSHPLIDDPGADTQPYYLSYATRNSSLDYARYAAMTAHILADLGDPEASDWLASAEAAFDYATASTVHPPAIFTVDGETLRFVDQPEPDDTRLLWAAIELAIATDEPVYDAHLSALDDAFDRAVGNLWWQQDFMRAVDVALHADELPAGWGDTVIEALTAQAEVWLAAEGANAYPWAWYDPSHRYHDYWAWGQGRYRPLVDLTAAWRLTGDLRFRTAALAGLDVQLGLNAQGRVDTTGLGDHRTVTALHLPSFADGIDEASPGITLYGALPSVAWQASKRVWGFEESSRSDPDYAGASLSLLPYPWDPAMTVSEVGITLGALLPAERRETLLESSRPEEMEFTVWETTSPAVAVTGMLLEPGWLPSAALTERQPLGADEFRQNLWAMP